MSTTQNEYGGVEGHFEGNAVGSTENEGGTNNKRPRRACCHLCGSSKGQEATGTAVRSCATCGTCFHEHDCGRKYAAKKLQGVGTCPRCALICLCSVASDRSVLEFKDEAALTKFRQEWEAGGVECQAYMRKMSNWSHRLRRGEKLSNREAQWRKAPAPAGGGPDLPPAPEPASSALAPSLPQPMCIPSAPPDHAPLFPGRAMSNTPAYGMAGTPSVLPFHGGPPLGSAPLPPLHPHGHSQESSGSRSKSGSCSSSSSDTAPLQPMAALEQPDAEAGKPWQGKHGAEESTGSAQPGPSLAASPPHSHDSSAFASLSGAVPSHRLPSPSISSSSSHHHPTPSKAKGEHRQSPTSTLHPDERHEEDESSPTSSSDDEVQQRAAPAPAHVPLHGSASAEDPKARGQAAMDGTALRSCQKDSAWEGEVWAQLPSLEDSVLEGDLLGPPEEMQELSGAHSSESCQAAMAESCGGARALAAHEEVDIFHSMDISALLELEQLDPDAAPQPALPPPAAAPPPAPASWGWPSPPPEGPNQSSSSSLVSHMSSHQGSSAPMHYSGWDEGQSLNMQGAAALSPPPSPGQGTASSAKQKRLKRRRGRGASTDINPRPAARIKLNARAALTLGLLIPVSLLGLSVTVWPEVPPDQPSRTSKTAGGAALVHPHLHSHPYPRRLLPVQLPTYSSGAPVAMTAVDPSPSTTLPNASGISSTALGPSGAAANASTGDHTRGDANDREVARSRGGAIEHGSNSRGGKGSRSGERRGGWASPAAARLGLVHLLPAHRTAAPHANAAVLTKPDPAPLSPDTRGLHLGQANANTDAEADTHFPRQGAPASGAKPPSGFLILPPMSRAWERGTSRLWGTGGIEEASSSVVPWPAAAVRHRMQALIALVAGYPVMVLITVGVVWMAIVLVVGVFVWRRQRAGTARRNTLAAMSDMAAYEPPHALHVSSVESGDA